jgi:5-methylcytosine-specific restriction enzyme B
MCATLRQLLGRSDRGYGPSARTSPVRSSTKTPILNALRPKDYLLINYNPRQTINYFSGESYGLNLTHYPGINFTGSCLIQEFVGEMDQPGAPALSDADRFDMFSAPP